MSRSKTAKAAWSVITVYLAVLVTGTLNKSIIPLWFDAVDWNLRWCITIPSIIWALMVAIEGFLWLTQPDQHADAVVGVEAKVWLFRLTCYLCAAILQSFLLYACTSQSFSDIQAFGVWISTFAVINAVFLIYNVVARVFQEQCGFVDKSENFNAIVYYFAWVSLLIGVYLLLPLTSSMFSRILMCLVSAAYFVAYFLVWGFWYTLAVSPTSEPSSSEAGR